MSLRKGVVTLKSLLIKETEQYVDVDVNVERQSNEDSLFMVEDAASLIKPPSCLLSRVTLDSRQLGGLIRGDSRHQ